MNGRPLVGRQLYQSLNNNSNDVVDNPEIIIQTPDPSTVRRGDKADFLKRLDDLETPSERLITLFKSLLNPYEDTTYEANKIRNCTLVGASIGFFHGAIIKSQDIHAKYIREHNAAVFGHKFFAHRHFFDSLVKNLSSRAGPYSFKSALLCAAASTTAFGSIAYRNDLYYPDWLIGFTALGSISRCWLGMRGVIGGGMFGVGASLIGYGFAKTYEFLVGQSVPQMRYTEHTLWLERRAAKRDALVRIGQKDFFERSHKLD